MFINDRLLLASGLSKLLAAAIAFKFNLCPHGLSVHLNFLKNMSIALWQFSICVDKVEERRVVHCGRRNFTSLRLLQLLFHLKMVFKVLRGFLWSNLPGINAMRRQVSKVVDADLLLSAHIYCDVGIRVSLVCIRMDAGHGHVQTIECIASLPLQPAPFCDFDCLFTFVLRGHLRKLSHVLGIEIALHNAWNVRGHHALIQNSFPVDISTPRVVLNSADLPFRDTTPRILM